MAPRDKSVRTMLFKNWTILQRLHFSPMNESASKKESSPQRENKLSYALLELGQCVNNAVEGDGLFNLFDGVWACRSSKPTEPSHANYMPMVCVIAQGKKQLLIGDERYIYDSEHFFLNSLSLPAAGQVIEANELTPCLWVMIELDPTLVTSVIIEAGFSKSVPSTPLRAMESSPIDRPLLESVVRLARLFESPQDAPFLAPLAVREIIYRLLCGSQAARLHQIAAHGGQAHRVWSAIDWLRENFDKPLSIEKLARQSGMSVSALHHHFKDVTAMSPLQFQKQLRLQEAKRLMLSQGMDAANAGFIVGYDDASYFSREYKRFFGFPPRQHTKRLRSEVA